MRNLLVLSLLTLAGPTEDSNQSSSPTIDLPTCVQEHILDGAERGQAATLVWRESSGGSRKVSVFFDESGRPRQYSEMKTSVPWETFDRQGVYRLVFLNFDTGLGVVETQDRDGQRVQEQHDVDEAFASDQFGRPAETVLQIKAACTDL